MIRQRLGSEVFVQACELILTALRDDKLLRGRKVGIDASVMRRRMRRFARSSTA